MVFVETYLPEECGIQDDIEEGEDHADDDDDDGEDDYDDDNDGHKNHLD